MRGISEFIKEHNAYLQNQTLDEQVLAYHLTQIEFLQHERLIHLMVMLFIALSTLICLALYFFTTLILFMVAFLVLLVLTFFYVVHYYKLENTVIQWYFVYNDQMKNQSHTR